MEDWIKAFIEYTQSYCKLHIALKNDRHVLRSDELILLNLQEGPRKAIFSMVSLQYAPISNPGLCKGRQY
uniref:Uncharacterized protein n=1 Tax=Oryza meridionalis TaxID=40149 RepID=A0A0E0CDC9_9ORYZ